MSVYRTIAFKSGISKSVVWGRMMVIVKSKRYDQDIAMNYTRWGGGD